MPKKTFYIIDGHAHIYRAYFAPFRDLTSPSGEPTKATDPNLHAHEDLPVLLVGKGGGTIKSGRYMRVPSEMPLNNLWMSMLDRFGAPTSSLGDGTGPLAGLA